MYLIKSFLLISLFSICSSIGFILSQKYSLRYENLSYLEQCIKVLETEIVYKSLPLPEALENVSLKGNLKVSYIFKEIKKDLLNNKRNYIYDSFLSVQELMEKELHFKKEDINIFLGLGRLLGSNNRNDEKNSFKLILNQLNSQIVEAKEEKNQNEKLYRSLGIVAGFGITILLI